MNTNRLKR